MGFASGLWSAKGKELLNKTIRLNEGGQITFADVNKDQLLMAKKALTGSVDFGFTMVGFAAAGVPINWAIDKGLSFYDDPTKASLNGKERVSNALESMLLAKYNEKGEKVGHYGLGESVA
jgi:hypothetical protein